MKIGWLGLTWGMGCDPPGLTAVSQEFQEGSWNQRKFYNSKFQQREGMAIYSNRILNIVKMARGTGMTRFGDHPYLSDSAIGKERHQSACTNPDIPAGGAAYGPGTPRQKNHNLLTGQVLFPQCLSGRPSNLISIN